MERRRAARRLLLGLLFTALAAPAGSAAELWRWIDADGVARFTPDPDRVPAARRSTLVRVEAGMPPAPQREPELAKPPPIFAPPGDPTLAEDPWNAPERAREVEGRSLRDPGEIIVEVPTAQPPPAPAPEAPEAAPPRSAPPDATAPGPATPAVAAAAPASGPAPVATAQPPSDSPPVAAPAPPRSLAPDRGARRAELAAAIARDEEALKNHVSSADAASIVASPELREIAERLPALQAELRALDAQDAAP
jgi:hypothetical protein